MQHVIERLNIVRQNITADPLNQIAIDEELSAILAQLETLDKEHTRQTEELRTLRETTGEIRRNVSAFRRKHNIWDDDVPTLSDDAYSILAELSDRFTAATDDAAALRGTLEGIRTTAVHGEIAAEPRDLLISIGYKAVEGLKPGVGVELRDEFRELQALVDSFVRMMRETGGWTYSSDRTLAAQIQRVNDYYSRMAVEAVKDSHSFKDGVVSWLRAIAINAQSVSWASTHREKDARLRGMIEVIETAITRIDELRLNDRLSSWNGVVDSWMKSDFPTREMRRRISDLEQEVQRLRIKAGEDSSQGGKHLRAVEDEPVI